MAMRFDVRTGVDLIAEPRFDGDPPYFQVLGVLGRLLLIFFKGVVKVFGRLFGLFSQRLVLFLFPIVVTYSSEMRFMRIVCNDSFNNCSVVYLFIVPGLQTSTTSRLG